MKHYSVLLDETIDLLNIKDDGVYIDATLGYAGHSSSVLRKLKRGFLFAFDQDSEAINFSEEALSKIGQNYKIINSNFSMLDTKMKEENVGYVDGIIFDLGVSSPQIDTISRGFSFMHDAILDMRMNQNQEFNAKELVNNYSLDDLVAIFFKYGEEKLSKVIAKKIVEYRESKEIETTKELTGIIASATGAKYFNLEHPDRRIFQAIRIEVNNELKVIETVLPDAINLLKKGGRLCVITFHSLEDRIVKQTFKSFSEVNEIYKGLPDIPEEYKPKIKLINKKPILPSEKELSENSRSRSAKLRVIERV